MKNQPPSGAVSGRPRRSKRSWIRRLAAGVFLLNLLAVTWPGIMFFRAPHPLILGLPLSMAWPVAWIVIGWITLLVLDVFEQDEDAD